MRWEEHITGIREKAYNILIGKPTEKGPLRSPGSTRDNNKMDLKEIRYVCVAWILLAEDRNIVMNFQVPSNAGNFFSCSVSITFSRMVQLQCIS
jgi:hypothetical protein